MQVFTKIVVTFILGLIVNGTGFAFVSSLKYFLIVSASHLELGQIPNIWKFGQKMVQQAYFFIY